MPGSTFSEKLKALREARGLSGYRISAEAGIDRALYARLETGQRLPTDDVISKIAPVLDVSFDELKAWADYDRLGPAGVANLLIYAFNTAWPVMGEFSKTADNLHQLMKDLPHDQSQWTDEQKSDFDAFAMRLSVGEADVTAFIEKMADILGVDKDEFAKIEKRFRERKEGPDHQAEYRYYVWQTGQLIERSRKNNAEIKPDIGKYPITDDEWAIIKAARDAGVQWHLDEQIELLDQPPEERKYVFRNLESFVDSIRLHKRLHG